jgi:hypothetical protein
VIVTAPALAPDKVDSVVIVENKGDLRANSAEIGGSELMRLFSVSLTPAN